MPRPGERLTSVRNPLVRRFRQVLEGKDRASLLLEGVRLVGDARDSRTRFEAVLASPRLDATARGRALRASLEGAAAPLFAASDEVVAAATESTSHQGIVALAAVPAWREEDLFPKEIEPLLVVAAGVQDPGNLGALLRVAEAAGATGAIATNGSAWPFQERCARASAGAILRLPTLAGLAPAEAVALLDRRGVVGVATDPRGGEDFRSVDWRGPVALLLGSEAHGLPGELRRAAKRAAWIPMRGRAESLNVAAAAAVLAFEIARARDVAAAESRR